MSPDELPPRFVLGVFAVPAIRCLKTERAPKASCLFTPWPAPKLTIHVEALDETRTSIVKRAKIEIAPGVGQGKSASCWRSGRSDAI